MTKLLAGFGLIASLALALAAPACSDGGERETDERAALDLRLETHAVLPGAPSEAGLAYVQGIAEVHREADAIDDLAARAELLLTAFERELPANDGTAELLHVELAARLTETLLKLGQAERVVEILKPLLAPARSLPLDRASARCLVNLGDAAARSGDHALAMSSYARALEVLSLMLEEMES